MKRTALPSLFLVALSAVLFGTASPATPQLQTLPGSVVRGERILATDGCLSCHSLNGKGGKRGPDLSIPSKTAGTPALFATSLWNHMPQMLSEIELLKIPAPTLKPTEAADLFAYFYSTLYFAPRGSASRGGTVFVDRRRSIRETWMDLKDPSIWAERMWNHASEMDSATSNRGIRWPRLSEQDVADLVTFLSTRAGTQHTPSR